METITSSNCQMGLVPSLRPGHSSSAMLLTALLDGKHHHGQRYLSYSFIHLGSFLYPKISYIDFYFYDSIVSVLSTLQWRKEVQKGEMSAVVVPWTADR